MHCGTLHRAHIQIHRHSWFIISTDLTGSLPGLPCYNILFTKTIRKEASLCDTMPSLSPSLGSVTACVAQMVSPFFSCRVQVQFPAVSEVMGMGRMAVMLPGLLLNKFSWRLLFWYFQLTLWTWDRSVQRHPNSSFEEESLVLTVDVMESSEGGGERSMGG